ncbi:Dihydrofolate reductase [Haloterrigena turkmenica DSM 5511]|uniref:dihydrofolate reductase n=1 Tax=Haloterrigena turkmenica (strain ATCC 51198 / DSM 5511 / JCM 9101 / NCIMB 13204 / VKM B-1734 / 4k) TaxID=543526 RepID=D2RRK6_HALTV|nr:dihydrofolate reductase [Haloterrigena turkmenica]ADB60566.1 Dihydrofolate reductase [Haloterrigena turkmenica DSM 5511]
MTAIDDSAPVETDRELVGIVAVADNGVIGKDGDMPWHIPADLKHFKETTMDHPIIMGRVTYEGILEALGEPLPGRTTVVLTSRDLETPENAVTARSLEEALEAAETAARERHDAADRIFVAGGATVYEQFLSALDRLIVTEVHEEPDGDTYFPDWDRASFDDVSRDDRDGFAFVEYVRRSS